MIKKLIFPLILIFLVSSSCESEAERSQRLAKEEKQRIELKEQVEQEERERQFQIEQERVAKEERDELERVRQAKLAKEERKRKEMFDKYINNSLRNGATPYSYCFGGNKSCSDYGCSQIKVKTPFNSDVMVTIKKNDKVYRHAFIKAGSRYTFEFPNGTYQAFFYYGKGWNPNKVMKQVSCGSLKGGFITDELFSKDNPQSLNNNILEYELVLQQNGNFSTKPSNLDEAF